MLSGMVNMLVVMSLISLPFFNIGKILIIMDLTADLNTSLRLGIIVLKHETYKNVIVCGLWEILIWYLTNIRQIWSLFLVLNQFQSKLPKYFESLNNYVSNGKVSLIQGDKETELAKSPHLFCCWYFFPFRNHDW